MTDKLSHFFTLAPIYSPAIIPLCSNGSLETVKKTKQRFVWFSLKSPLAICHSREYHTIPASAKDTHGVSRFDMVERGSGLWYRGWGGFPRKTKRRLV
jgi:hypothetical protein